MIHSGKGPAKIVANAVVLLFCLSCIIPFLIVVVISLSDQSSIQQFGYQIIPKAWSLEAYRALLKNPTTVARAYGVNIYITAIGTVLALTISVLTSYVLSRQNFIGRRALNVYVFFTMLFSGGMVPLYILVTQYLHLKNNLWSIILTGLVVPYQIFMLRTFFQQMPSALIEAAKIDGASEFRVLFRIVVPMNTGAIATVAIMLILAYWNDWYRCMLYITKPKLYNLQYMLMAMMGRLSVGQESGMMMTEQLPEDSLRMALCVFAVGPTVLIFPFFQKYFVQGLSTGAVKG